MKNIIYLVSLKPSSHRTAEEGLGIQYLAACLIKEGYIAKIRDAWLDTNIDEDSIINEILKEKENVLFVGISSYMLNNKASCEMTKKLKKLGINVACGGFGPTFEPDIFLQSGADFVMVGEGETTIIEVAKYFEHQIMQKEKINGVIFLKNKQLVQTEKRTAIKNLDNIPFPVRPYLDIIKNKKSTINVLTSRGCMGSCTFCSISAFLCKQNGLRWRARSIENIIEELKILQSKGAKTIKFIDDSFIENERDEKWCKKFYNAIKLNNIKMNFRSSIRADKVNAKSMKYLHKAGFFSFSCGIENYSKTALARMAKRATVNDNIKAIKIMHHNKIYIQAGFILFDNKTTIKELKENYVFLKKHLSLISKGIFSEMYAAAGTVFTKLANLESENKFNSNNLYLVEDLQSREVYNYLKKWQLHHSKIYDMVIDPISAPKDIKIKLMKKYQKLMIKMKRKDLNFMKKILFAVENRKQCESIYLDFERKNNDFYQKIGKKVLKYYKIDGLNYDADINGFLKTNYQNASDQTLNVLIKNNKILNNAINIVSSKYRESGNIDLYENHILPCMKICIDYAQKHCLNVLSAAFVGLFHDYGKLFLKGDVDNHEIIGSDIAKRFLIKNRYTQQEIYEICQAIENHKFNANDEEMSDFSKMIINADSLSYLEYIDYFKEYIFKNEEKLTALNILKEKILCSLNRIDEYGKEIFETSDYKDKIYNILNDNNKFIVF